MSESSVCASCSTEVSSLTFHCNCGNTAVFKCVTCDHERVVSIKTPPSCHLCETQMVEKTEADYKLNFAEEIDGIDQEMAAAHRGWLKFLENRALLPHMPLTLRQRRRLQVYDRLLWKIDNDLNPPEKELIYR